MTTSAIFMALLGLSASFLPQELLAFANAEVGRFAIVLVQVTGALYLGFALLNWMARGVLIGGIYSRPLALGNFMHFAVATTVLAKVLVTEFSLFTMVGVSIYAVFAAWFALVLFTHPLGTNSD
jgi:hypothetical protein